MKNLISLIYHLLTWSILLILFISFSLLFILESPSSFFKLVKAPLKEQGISYGKIEGSLLSGFVLHDVNYQNQVKAKSVALKIDLHQLENRVLYIEDLVLNAAQINKDFLATIIEANSTSESSSEENISLPFDRIIIKHLELSLLDTSYDAYHVNHAKLTLSNVETDMKKSHKGEMKFVLDSNVSQLDIEASFKNEKFKFLGTIEGERLFIQPFLAEQNVTLLSNPILGIKADGKMESIDFTVNIKKFKVTQNELNFNIKALNIKGNTKPLQGNTAVSATLLFDSSIVKGELFTNTKLNFNSLKETLKFELKSSVSAYESYLNPLLKESNVTLEGDTFVNLESSGTLEKVKIKLNVLATIIKENIRSKVRLKTEDIFLDLKKEEVSGRLSLSSDAANLALTVESQFAGNYMKPKRLKTNSSIDITKFDAFSVNLTELLPLKLTVNTDTRGANIELVAKKLQLSANTSDYEHIKFAINTEKIYPSKILELSLELKDKFIQLEVKGEATLSSQYFSLKGSLQSNKNFKVNINAYSQENGLDVNVFSKHFKLNAKGDLQNKEISISVNIDSLKKVQKEFQSLYPFSTVPIDGALRLDARIKGEKLNATLTSPKLKLEGFNIENLELNADYDDMLVTLNKLNFKTTGFKEKGLNQNFYLNQKGLVNLGEKKEIFLDIHPKILVKASGNSENLKAIVQIEALFLGYPEYGTTELSCDIDYTQTGVKKKITGAVFLDKMKIFYESKFLDPSADNDVVIIHKKDKDKKIESDSFLNDTFINLAIYAGEANYKTRDIDLTLDVNVNAKKEFGQTLRMLGKVEAIQGRVEQAPKLFTVIDSNIVFKGEKEINPLLDLKVEHELPDILISINIHGTAKRPKLTFSSEPPLPKKDILSYLLLGVSTAGLGEGKGSLGREAQLFIMNQAARDLAYELELDRVFVKDDGTGEGYAVQVGKKVQEDTMFIIENSTEGNSFILEYDVSKNIKVEVGQHQKTVPSQSIDIYFRKRFK